MVSWHLNSGQWYNVNENDRPLVVDWHNCSTNIGPTMVKNILGTISINRLPYNGQPLIILYGRRNLYGVLAKKLLDESSFKRLKRKAPLDLLGVAGNNKS